MLSGGLANPTTTSLLLSFSIFCCWRIAIAEIGNTFPILQAAGIAEEPARVSCNAAYSAPCARTNAEWLAKTSAALIADRIQKATAEASLLLLDEIWENVSQGEYNMERGFYPFVFSTKDAHCLAHGANPALAGRNLTFIFDQAGIGFSNVDDLFQRFVEASERGGDWVQYLWSDGGTINSKLAFVTNITVSYFIGVGYESRPLPMDLPCSSEFDSWCSVTNVRSLVGKAQFRLYQSETLSQFEATVFDLSFDEEEFQVPGGFYIFMYSYDGRLKSHALLHNHFGHTMPQIFVQNKLGTNEEANRLHEQFILAAEGQAGGWIRYKWQNDPNEPSFEKVAFIAKIEFQEELYYLGAGFNFESQAVHYDNVPEGFTVCTDAYNLPCAFQTSLQLSSHAFSYAISSFADSDSIWDAISYGSEFRSGDFYLYIYDFNGTCMAHGQVPENAGQTLTQVYETFEIPLDAKELHEKFRQAAMDGGGWVAYEWVQPGIANSIFRKMAYLFRINIGDRSYYGGVGFSHARAPIQYFSDIGTKANGNPIACSRNYDLECSENNVRAILGQSVAELTLASSEAHVANEDEQFQQHKMKDVLESISSRDPSFTAEDFYVSVFSNNGTDCALNDGTGCCIAHGWNPTLVGKSWQQILDIEEISSISGHALHEQFVSLSNSQTHTQYSDVLEIPWSGEYGEAQTKRAVTARYKDNDENFYVVASYFKTPLPPTCDACPIGMGCTSATQQYCKEKPEGDFTLMPWVIALISLNTVAALFLFWYKRRSWLKRQAMKKKIHEMEEQMQGMVEVLYDTGVHFDSAEKYREEFGIQGTGSSGLFLKPEVKAFWCWEEDEPHIQWHTSSRILAGTSFVRYENDISDQIERAYQRWKSGMASREHRIDLTDKIRKVNNPQTGAQYKILFDFMVQENIANGFQRAIRREEVAVPLCSTIKNNLPPLPADIGFFQEDGEDFLPTFKGQVIQVSKEHPDKQWLYGSILHDPLIIDAKEESQTDNAGLKALLSNVLHERPTTGWFPKTVSKPAGALVMRNLMQSLGGEGMKNLQPPDTWSPDKEGILDVSRTSSEYHDISRFFLAALGAQRECVEVMQVERIQSTPLWQTYAVKKETMKARNAKHPESLVNNTDLDAVEFRWLFHGTEAGAIPKIINQGFNRAFAGRNAVAYGKGVYFAREASYSSHPSYSTPDERGIQRMFLCRVAVGDWCEGHHGQLTPDTKPRNGFELFDSTVDNIIHPSIFVVYHDAQAYPEYLVSFKRTGEILDC